jgi:hypothetical protein
MEGKKTPWDNVTYLERLERKLGYENGFIDGILATNHCSSCELLPQCDYNEKTIEVCPYSKYKGVVGI